MKVVSKGEECIIRLEDKETGENSAVHCTRGGKINRQGGLDNRSNQITSVCGLDWTDPPTGFGRSFLTSK